MIKGTIVFLKANEESKSAGTFPYLVLENGEKVKIRLVNANPFENNELALYENKQVQVEGDYNEFKTFMATSIECVDGEKIEVKDGAINAVPDMDIPIEIDLASIPLNEDLNKNKESVEEENPLIKTLSDIKKSEDEQKQAQEQKKEEKKKLSLLERFKLLFTHKKH